MKNIRLVVFLVLLMSVFVFAGCTDEEKESNAGTTRVEIRLTDAPAPYDAVNINIQSVSLHVNSDWVELDLLHPGVYNLLDFQNGIDTLLAGEDVPSGIISQIRLVLGDEGNSIVKDGETYQLEIPSAQQSGLKLNLHDELIPDIVYRLWIDFDASRSIVETGSGKYQLKPVIRSYTDAIGGSLRGIVLPQDANAVVWGVLSTDSILAYPRPDGCFLLPGLQPSSSWKIVFEPDEDSGYKVLELTGVSVVAGQVTDLGQTILIKE